MISILQRILQKHHKWLFSILLVIVTISFVFTVGSSPGVGRNTHGQKKKVFGCDLTSQREIAQRMQEVEQSAQAKKMFVSLPQLKEYAFFVRLALLCLANTIGIPPPKKYHLDKYAETLSFFMDDEGEFIVEKYNAHIEALNKDPAQKAVFEHTISNDFRIDTVQKLLAGPGYSTAAEAKISLQTDQTKYSYSVACFNHADISQIHYTENDLEQHLGYYREKYKIDEQIVLEYIEFPNDLFKDKIQYPTESEIQSFYTKHRPDIKDLEKNSEPWKKAVAEAYKNEEAKKMAMAAADQFIYQLYEKNITLNSPEFSKLLNTQNLSIKELAPITVGQFSGHQQFSAGVLEQVSKLNQGRYYSDPIFSKSNTVCVLLHKEIIPTIYPPLEDIKEQVRQDYLKTQAEEFLFHKVESVRLQLTIPNPMIHDQFITIAEENNGVITEFKAVEISPDDHDPIHEIIRFLPLRQISQVITKNEKEKELILVTAKEAPALLDEAKILVQQKELEELNRNLFRDYLSELILHELGIKDDQDPIAKQMRIIAPLYNMQLPKPKSEP
ncbi:MAG: peptidyl-prolyl cis-trans isomerase [Puniceicoccales bacterium]|jgi:peptidyl-prolyl cis-trans isomerase D|nr:peptidyl-prolyl cis-trans isomerase [Puniceicoccales bacterium]